ncbi:hypothetical protein CRE_02710 [Caenorhabditis remanei]|uniref:SET domain-containing protein n=1 Tax=Caenorhabditis remanei TaxID=31234 RepID=E3NMY7_CAERE|nr:hypothetical protein CRE_02710 [Caenorhabditis remanei]
MSFHSIISQFQIPNSNEKSDLYAVLKNAVNVYTPIVKGLLQPQLVAERPAGDLERILAFRKEQKTRFNDESDKARGVMVKENIGRGEWILEMTGEIYLESQVKDRSIMEGENSHYLYKDIRLGAGNEPICMAVWKQETVGKYIRRSCQPTCRLVHLYGTELHLMVEAQRPMKSGEEVTLPLEADCQGFKDQLKCLHHQANPEDCPLEKERLLRKASNENPTAYSTVVTLTDSDEEIEIIVPRQPESMESPGSSSSDASARPSPEAPKAPPVLLDSEIQGSLNRENGNRRENEENQKNLNKIFQNLPVTPQVPTTTPNPVAQNVIFIEDPLRRDTSTSGDAPAVNDPREPRSLRAVSPPNDAASSSSTSLQVSFFFHNFDFKVPEISTSQLTHVNFQNAEPETAPETMDAPEPMDTPEAAAYEPEEALAPVDVATPAPPTRRRLRSAGNGRSGALDLTEPEQAAVPVIVAGPSTRTHHRESKKSAGAPSRRARVQVNMYAVRSPADTSPITDRHTRHTRPTARSAPVPPTIHNAPVVAPPAGRKNRRAQLKALAANARRCHREQNEALAATNVDSAPAPPGAPTAPVVVDHPTTRRRRASQACSPVATVSTRRRAASRSESRPAPSSFPAPPPAPPAVSAPPRVRQISMGDQDAIALIGQSMHPTRAAVKQLRGKNPNEGQAGQGWTSGAPAVKKPRKTARLQQVKRGGDGKK